MEFLAQNRSLIIALKCVAQTVRSGAGQQTKVAQRESRELMKVQFKNAIIPWRGLLFALPLFMAFSAVVPAQKSTSPAASPAPSPTASGCTMPPSASHDESKTPSKITPEQARQLFALVDVLI